MEKDMIRVVDTDGVELDVELISILEDKEENNKYLVYTKGETQKNGNLILYIAKIVIAAIPEFNTATKPAYKRDEAKYIGWRIIP